MIVTLTLTSAYGKDSAAAYLLLPLHTLEYVCACVR